MDNRRAAPVKKLLALAFERALIKYRRKRNFPYALRKTETEAVPSRRRRVVSHRSPSRCSRDFEEISTRDLAHFEMALLDRNHPVVFALRRRLSPSSPFSYLFSPPLHSIPPLSKSEILRSSVHLSRPDFSISFALTSAPRTDSRVAATMIAAIRANRSFLFVKHE